MTYEGVNMGFVMEHFFTRAVITSLKYLRLLKKIITEEGCSEVILVKHNADTAEIKDIVPQSWDKVTNDIIHCLKGELDIRVTEIENLSPKEKAKREPIVDLKDIVCLLVSPLRHLFNFFVNFRDKGKKRVAMVGAPRLIFPILDEVKRRGLYDTVYFQKRLAPRMVFDMLKRGIPYRIESDYRVRNERKVLSDHKSKLEENRRLLLENSQVEEFFSFEGINFFPAIKGRIDYAFRKFMPGMLEEVIRFKRFIKDEKLDFLVIDEDLKQFARPLILCMNQAGVKSLELLHGLYGYFHTSSLVTTKKAVWGNCLKRYFASAGRIPVDALVPTGCPILDVLPKRDKHGDSLRVRKDFGIGEKTRIVLFPSRPFKRGAKGGMVGIHIDRIKYENMLVSVIRTLKDLDGVHLIVKMHHNDSSGDYNRNIIMREGYDKPFTVVQDYNMYSLLNAADLLVTPASTTTVEAIVLDMPVILLNYRREDSLYPFEKWGAVKGVYD
ncbi:MAG: CDP-glycerol glycerophosphotransferase family protein, partial [Candidatus Omnitrophota bacterium]